MKDYSKKAHDIKNKNHRGLDVFQTITKKQGASLMKKIIPILFILSVTSCKFSNPTVKYKVKPKAPYSSKYHYENDTKGKTHGGDHEHYHYHGLEIKHYHFHKKEHHIL